MRCSFKVSIIGTGNVGATIAYALLLDGSVTDLVLVAHDVYKAEGEKLDLEHSVPYLQPTAISVTDDYKDIAGSDLTIVTAGAAQKEGEDRLSLLKRNAAIFQDIIPQIYKANPNGLVLIISNPVDVLTHLSYALAPFKLGQVFGSGTALDTARFRFHLSELFQIDSKSIHAYILGEHGDTSFPVLSSTHIGGQSLHSFKEYSEEKVIGAFEKAKNAAYQIIERKGSTYYAIATVALNIVRSVYTDARTVLPLSTPIHILGIEKDISLSMPCVLTQNGVEQVLHIPLSSNEEESLKKSAETLSATFQQLV